MVISDVGTRRSVFTLIVVMCCFGVLWPKVFYPMMQSSLSTFSNDDAIDSVPSNYLPKRMRESMGEARPLESSNRRGNARIMAHPSVRWIASSQPKGSGAFGFVMPFYTIAIGIFFIYTIVKLLFNKSIPEKSLLEKQTSLEHRYETLNISTQQYTNAANIASTKHVEKLQPDRRTKQVLEDYGKDKVRKALTTLINEMTNVENVSNLKQHTTNERNVYRRYQKSS